MNMLTASLARTCLIIPAACFAGAAPHTLDAADGDAVERPLRLEPRPGNPRNSEGDFLRLDDGRLMFVYTHFTGGGSDHAAAHLAARFSSDGGRTWTREDAPVLPNEGGFNVMSVSLVRLRSGGVALFYLRKESLTDCRVYLRTLQAAPDRWTAPVLCIPDEVGYYVMNNDRAVQLASGRLVLPVAQHNTPAQDRFDPHGLVMCYLSDDDGRTWRRSRDTRRAVSPEGRAVILQEPGVVELRDGRLMMFCRTGAGSQYVAHSRDGGETWSEFGPSNIVSPLSPASIERIPSTGDLLLVWNNHEDAAPEYRGKRTPLCVAVSRDEGRTWQNTRRLEADPDGWYCYTAIEFVENHVLLGHCAGNRRRDGGLAVTQITRFPVEWLTRP